MICDHTKKTCVLVVCDAKKTQKAPFVWDACHAAQTLVHADLMLENDIEKHSVIVNPSAARRIEANGDERNASLKIESRAVSKSKTRTMAR